MPAEYGFAPQKLQAKADRLAIHQIHPNQDGGYKKYYEFKTRSKCQIPDGRRILNNTQLLIVGFVSYFIYHSVKCARGNFIENYRFGFMVHHRNEKLYYCRKSYILD